MALDPSTAAVAGVAANAVLPGSGVLVGALAGSVNGNNNTTTSQPKNLSNTSGVGSTTVGGIGTKTFNVGSGAFANTPPMVMYVGIGVIGLIAVVYLLRK